MVIRLKTDGSITHRGFRMHITTEDIEEPSKALECRRERDRKNGCSLPASVGLAE